jgi:hypothetical protein
LGIDTQFQPRKWSDGTHFCIMKSPGFWEDPVNLLSSAAHGCRRRSGRWWVSFGRNQTS